MDIKKLEQDNFIFAEEQDYEMMCYTGYIGHFSGRAATHESPCQASFHEKYQERRTAEFEQDSDALLASLQFQEPAFLGGPDARKKAARKCPGKKFSNQDGTWSGYQISTEDYTYFLLCQPKTGDFQIFCYIKKQLDFHAGKSREGIRFVDPMGRELFRIPDGGKIRLASFTGEIHEYTCRFIDECHTKISNLVFHVCEFAELCERNGNRAEPARLYLSFTPIARKRFRFGKLQKLGEDGEEKPFRYKHLSFVPAWKFPKDSSMYDISPYLSRDTDLGFFDEGFGWNYKEFYEASSVADADVFYCQDNHKYYVPGDHELFQLVV